MRAFVSLISALALTIALWAQAPSATKTGTVAKKTTVAKKATTTTATKKGTPAVGTNPGGFANDDERVLYTIGMYFQDIQQKQLKTLELTPAEAAIVKRGMLDAMNGRPALKLDDWGPKMNEFANARAEQAAQKLVGPEKAAGAAYLAKEAAVAGTVKTTSGLLYRELKAGTGPSPTAADTVKVNYRGTLTNGTEFDASEKHGGAAELPLSGVIPCWTEGMQLMKVGGKALLVCPSDLAYRERGSPPVIPGGATLVFEIELLEITTPPAAPVPAKTE